MPGPWEWIIIFVAILLIFGAKRLPEIAKSLGKSIKEFRKATTDIKKSIEEETSEEEPSNDKKNVD